MSKRNVQSSLASFCATTKGGSPKRAKREKGMVIGGKEVRMEGGWPELVGGEMEKGYFRKLVEFLEGEMETKKKRVYPEKDKIFEALNLCPVEKVKVVILGQDPYHGEGQAHGLAFSVGKNVPMPPSLKNIYKEAVNDVGIDMPKHGNLTAWATQGVLLLNTVLTVQANQAFSHRKKG